MKVLIQSQSNTDRIAVTRQTRRLDQWVNTGRNVILPGNNIAVEPEHMGTRYIVEADNEDR